MLAALTVEFRKLNRSLALLLALAAPALIAMFTFFNLLRLKAAMPWEMILANGAGIWAFFMLPMSVTALTALVAHMEHGPRSWDHLRALPVPRWRLYAAKSMAVLAVVAVMSVGVTMLDLLAGGLASMVRPELEPTGPMNLTHNALVMGRMFLAALLLVAVQLWVALRFASFVPGLILGIAGTFFAVVATGARAGVFLPWQMPVNMMSHGWRLETALALGAAGGLFVFALMLVHLSRREVL